MSGIPAYIFRQVLGPLIFFIFALVGVAWLSQSLRMLDLVINQSQSAATYLYLTVLALPQVVGLLLPFALIIAVIYALNRMYVESELVVIWAAGFNRWAVIWPILGIAALTTIGGYFINLAVMPAGMREVKDRVFEIRADLVNTFVREGAFTNPIAGLTVYVSENNAGGDIRGILVHDARSPKSVATYMAQRGLLANTPVGPRLIMFKGNVQWLEGGAGHLKVLVGHVDPDRLAAKLKRHKARRSGPAERIEHDAPFRAGREDRHLAQVFGERCEVSLALLRAFGKDLPNIARLAAVRVILQEVKSLVGQVARSAGDLLRICSASSVAGRE